MKRAKKVRWAVDRMILKKMLSAAIERQFKQKFHQMMVRVLTRPIDADGFSPVEGAKC
jgi:hypothetical protein